MVKLSAFHLILFALTPLLTCAGLLRQKEEIGWMLVILLCVTVLVAEAARNGINDDKAKKE